MCSKLTGRYGLKSSCYTWSTSYNLALFSVDNLADAGTLVDSYVSGKIVQLKEQIATLEKREERSAAGEIV